MRVGLPTGVVEAGSDETITGLWTFANALGFLTDDINERTADEGVTIDGLLVKDSGIPQAAVTAHEAALAILETQIVDGSLLARLAAAETIAGLWTFANAGGFLTDIIAEFTGGAGVRIDGVLLKDGILDVRGLVAANTAWLISNVAGDGGNRFLVKADGTMEWGDGVAGRDTNLFRAAADELATFDDFNVGGTLDLGGALEVNSFDIALSANSDDLSPGAGCLIRVDAAGAFAITGFSGGATGRVLIVSNVNTQAFTLNDQDANSDAANRIITSIGANLALLDGDSAILVYDSTTLRWRIVSSTT